MPDIAARHHDRLALPAFLLLAALVGGCAPSPAPVAIPSAGTSVEWDEVPAATNDWRGHRLARCPDEIDVPTRVEGVLGLCSELFRDASGSDGMIELEMALEAGERHPLVLFTLGQLYLLGGKGDPTLLPVEGPAADVGDWKRNRRRLFGRAEALLTEVGRARGAEAAVDFLLADLARARGDRALAATLDGQARTKCTGGRYFRVMQLYRRLDGTPARMTACATPTYPMEAVARGASGRVTLDVLVDPDGRPRQTVEVSSPDPALSQEASRVFLEGSYEAARVGDYPVWAWVRAGTSFRLKEAS